MSATVIDLDVARVEREAGLPVWRNVKGTCRACGGWAISTVHLETPLDNTECSCGAWEWCVTHFVVDDQLVPRLELVEGG